MRSNTAQLRQRSVQTGTDLQLVRNLGSSIAVAMNLAPGNQLVLLLGAGDERTNREALETWVRLQLPTLRGMTNQQLLAELIHRLEKLLTDYLEVGP
ncbi:hypothetical protein ABWH88_09935 [Marinobacter adhaerens]|uniref:Uncharacterized protein n=2 Tax=Marinobacter adhaerens TaxID=1033846 RepID=A0ABX8ILE2_9GAMM|nr:hypothetical protein [Marinobacter adhaerens]QWV13890.1 hypothetical protein KQ249_04510 [Marinobacter adhaerens]